MIEAFAVGGNGGSFAQRYWDFLRVPNFPDSIKQRIVNLYYAGIDYKSPQLECHNLDDFNVALLRFVNSSGIFELHKLKSIFQKTIDLAIQSIIEDKEVKVEYNLFMRCGIATALS